jgi:hypothetical protein
VPGLDVRDLAPYPGEVPLEMPVGYAGQVQDDPAGPRPRQNLLRLVAHGQSSPFSGTNIPQAYFRVKQKGRTVVKDFHYGSWYK